MREILFRGKRKDNGEWVEGGYFFEPYVDKAHIIRWNSTGMGFNEFIEVGIKTVGQYIGLRDKFGRRIFEGDIVKFYWPDDEYINFEIAFISGEFLAVTNSKRNDVWDVRVSGLEKELEVIGNIHDCPELLKEGERDA